MHRALSFRRLREAALLLMAGSVIGACAPTAEGTAESRQARRQRVAQRRGVAITAKQNAQRAAQSDMVGGAGGRRAIEVPFQRRSGWLVKGTDLLLFLPCGEGEDYLVTGPGPALARINQRYKFEQPRPYTAMYVELNVRLLHDTTTVGGNTFTRVADTEQLFPAADTPPACRRPTQSRVVEIINRYL